MKKDSSFFLVV